MMKQGLATRAQRIVGYLEKNVRDLPEAKHARLARLSGMIQRNGLLQTVVFLEAKANKRQGKDAGSDKEAEKDARLLKHLRGAVRATLDVHGTEGPQLKREDLAACSPTEYLLLSEVALEVATWMARHADARETP